MATARPQLGSRAELDVQIAALRQAGRHIQSVAWQGQPAWLKLSTPQPPAWRYRLQGGIARLFQLSAFQPVRPQGGAAGIRNEVDRISALAAAGLRVPQLLEHADRWLLISDLGDTTLESLMRHADADAQLAHWLRGAAYILQAHRAGQYLGQPFARNLVCSPQLEVGAIDFEDDPIGVMPLAQAQIRDWMSYFFSTAIYFPERLSALRDAVRKVLAQEDAAVRDGIQTLLRRSAWLRWLRGLPQGLQRRDVRKTRYFGELAWLSASSPPIR
jgi:hypothetical protein